jgi:hypothetical protein
MEQVILSENRGATLCMLTNPLLCRGFKPPIKIDSYSILLKLVSVFQQVGPLQIMSLVKILKLNPKDKTTTLEL